jgi:hypothetical protein
MWLSDVVGLQEGFVQTFEMERHINAPRAVAWMVLSDLDGWGQHAPNLSKTEVVEAKPRGRCAAATTTQARAGTRPVPCGKREAVRHGGRYLSLSLPDDLDARHVLGRRHN